MLVNVDQITSGLIKYIDTELAPQATGMMKFMLYFVVPSIPKKVVQMTQQYRNDALFSDLFDENGNVKLDDVKVRAKEAISKIGRLYIEKLNLFIDETDVEKLYNLIKNS